MSGHFERARRYLIVNADDFGLSEGVNRGIIEAHERGIVTSTSLMVRGRAADDAGKYAATHLRLSTGLHVDLGEWRFLHGEWVAVYEVVPLTDKAAVEAELHRQIGMFVDLAGMRPTHLDSHQHVHEREPLRSLLKESGRRLGVPVRHLTPEIRYCGEFYGQTGEGESRPDAIRVENLLTLLEHLCPGYTELACHPGFASDLDTMYRDERAAELAALCDPRVRRALAGGRVTLRGFRDVFVESSRVPGPFDR